LVYTPNEKLSKGLWKRGEKRGREKNGIRLGKSARRGCSVLWKKKPKTRRNKVSRKRRCLVGRQRAKSSREEVGKSTSES